MTIVPHPNCQKCQLFAGCKTPYMESSGAEEPLVLVVGEAPGAVEDSQGVPFVGKSGQLLRQTLEVYGFDIGKDVRFTNVVKCRPPDNKISKSHINYCKHYVLDEIKHYQPELVLLMGNSPLNAVLGENSITQWNGVVVERDDATYVPLYHPAYLLRNASAMDEWAEGFDKAIKVLDGKPSDDAYDRYYPHTLSDVLEMVKFAQGCEVIAYDVETGSLDPFYQNNTVPCISIACGGRTYGVPLQHKDSPFNQEQLEVIYGWLEELLTDPDKRIIGHNIKFDQQHTRKGLCIEFEAGGDTMLLSHMLDSQSGRHSLKRLAGLHLGMYDYDKPLQDYKAAHPECNPERGGSYANIPLSILLPYAALDTEATHKLWDIFWGMLTPKQRILHDELIIQASNVLARVEYNGNTIDLYIAERYIQVYRHIQNKLLSDIKEHPAVIHTVMHFQQLADMKLISDLPAGAQCVDMDNDYMYYTLEKSNGNTYEGKRKRDIIEFNPNSTNQLKYLYFHRMGLIPLEHTASGEPSTKSKLMVVYAKDHPIVDLITHYKLLTKMLGTYLVPAATGEWAGADGRVRSTYNLHGTVTGRLSSSKPNMQNIPTPEKEADARPNSVVVHLPVKNIFTTSFEDGYLMSVDYSGMELRVFASLARCEPMLEIHESGADFHSMVALMALTGKTPSQISIEDTKQFKKTSPEVRYIYKWTNWTLLYGGDAYTLVRLYNIPKDDAETTVRNYYQTFPEVLQYKVSSQRFAEKHGYIESPFGRREALHYINDDNEVSRRNADRRAAVNMPVQSAASDILLCALIVIDHLLYVKGMRSMIVNTVHDSIVIDVPADEVDSVAELCVEVMENIKSYAPEYFPNLDFTWLLSPLKADVSIGTHYGAEMDMKEWVNNGRKLYA